MSCRRRFLSHLQVQHLLEDAGLIAREKQLWLEAGESMIEYLKQRNVYFAHKLGSVSLNNVEQRIEHIFLHKGSQEVIMQVREFLTVWYLNQISHQDYDELHKLKMSTQSFALRSLVKVSNMDHEDLEALLLHK